MVVRFLVGAASVAVIAFVGYYFWQEHQRGLTREKADRAYHCDRARRDLEASRAGRRTPDMESDRVLEFIVRNCIAQMEGR